MCFQVLRRRVCIVALGVTLGATPNPIAPGGATTLAGQLTGTNNAGRQIVLQGNPFPYLQGFVNVTNPQVTDAAGNFSLPLLSVRVTTQYRVQMPARPEVVSPIVVLGAAVQVRTDAKKVARHRHSVSVRFRGSVSPAARERQADALFAANISRGLAIDARTARCRWTGEAMDYGMAVEYLIRVRDVLRARGAALS